MSVFFLSPLMGPFYFALCILTCGLLCGREGLALFKKPKKASINSRIFFISYALFFTAWFAVMPRIVIRPTLLENSGFPKSEYPLVHEVLYEQNTNIFMASLCLIFMIFVTGLRAGSLKYQFSNLGASIIHAVLISQAAEGIVSCYYFG